VGSCGSLWLGDVSGLSGWRLSQGEVLGWGLLGYLWFSELMLLWKEGVYWNLLLLLFFIYYLFFICFFFFGVNSNEKQLSMQLTVFLFILLYFLFRTITNQVSCGKLWEFVVGRCVRIVWMEIESRWSAWVGIIIGYLWFSKLMLLWKEGVYWNLLLLFFFIYYFFFICFFCFGVNSNEKQLSMQLTVFLFILLYFLFRTITNQVSCGKLWEFVVGRCVRIVWMEIESRWSAWVGIIRVFMI
jgi:hypothetical protein